MKKIILVLIAVVALVIGNGRSVLLAYDGKGEEAIFKNEKSVQEMVRHNTTWKIVIINPNWIPDLAAASAVENEVFLRGYEISELNVPLNDKFILWDTPKANCKYSEKDREKYERVTVIRKELKEKKEEAQKCVYQDEWSKIAPNDAEYLKCIQTLEELGKAEYSGRKGSYKVFFDAANDYFSLALEYQIQTDNEEAVTYYYAKSIECTMKAFPYVQGNKEKWYRTYDFLYQRYHDAADVRADTSDDDKMRAEKICELLQQWRKDK